MKIAVIGAGLSGLAAAWLYQALGVPSEPVSYATSFAGADGRLYFRYRNRRWGDRSVSVLAPQDLLLGVAA